MAGLVVELWDLGHLDPKLVEELEVERVRALDVGVGRVGVRQGEVRGAAARSTVAVTGADKSGAHARTANETDAQLIPAHLEVEPPERAKAAWREAAFA